MRLRLISFVGTPPGWAQAAADSYLQLLPWQVTTVVRKPQAHGSSLERLKREGVEVKAEIAKAPAPRIVICLDEQGRQLNSLQFADQFRKWQNASLNPVFVIGSADGLASEVKAEADLLLALSTFTLPHTLARLLLLEQCYRAYSILNNHPYHRP